MQSHVEIYMDFLKPDNNNDSFEQHHFTSTGSTTYTDHNNWATNGRPFAMDSFHTWITIISPPNLKPKTNNDELLLISSPLLHCFSPF